MVDIAGVRPLKEKEKMREGRESKGGEGDDRRSRRCSLRRKLGHWSPMELPSLNTCLAAICNSTMYYLVRWVFVVGSFVVVGFCGPEVL